MSEGVMELRVGPAYGNAGQAAGLPLALHSRSVVELGEARQVPLVMDLDGTVVCTDVFLEAVLAMIRRAPVSGLLLPAWLLRGRAFAKRKVAERAELDAATLPYRERVCAYAREQKAAGRVVVLATANDELLALRVARHLGAFDRIIASDGAHNLKGRAKRDRLVTEFGERGFDYAGDSRADLPVWVVARLAIVVGGRRLREAVGRRTTVELAIDEPSVRFAALRALRPHHWLKNLLIFVPLFAAQRVGDLVSVERALLAFATFCLIASAMYVVNDLLDLSSDRRHPRKRLRPIAAGDLPLAHALAMAPLLLVAAGWLSLRVTIPFAWAAALYCLLVLAYSLRFKDIVLLDVLLLAGFYVLRVLAGAAAVDVPVSRWLLGFSMFASLSLALLKRHTEIVTMRDVIGHEAVVRGYRSSDAALLTAMGIASGFLAAVILALYVDSAEAAYFYARSDRLWLACPVFLYWISHLWLMAERNRMTFDPVVFAVTNRTSLALIVVMLGLVVSAL